MRRHLRKVAYLETNSVILDQQFYGYNTAIMYCMLDFIFLYTCSYILRI